MSSEQGKGQEWWLTEFQDDNGLYFKQASQLEPVYRGQWISHVIEHSAYAAAVARAIDAESIADAVRETAAKNDEYMDFKLKQVEAQLATLTAENERLKAEAQKFSGAYVPIEQVRELKLMAESYRAIGLKLLNAYWSKLAERMLFPENVDLIKEARQALEKNGSKN